MSTDLIENATRAEAEARDRLGTAAALYEKASRSLLEEGNVVAAKAASDRAALCDAMMSHEIAEPSPKNVEKEAIARMVADGNFFSAAQRERSLADQLEDWQCEEACEMYSTAAKLYELAAAQVSADQCWTAVAENLALLGRLSEASDLYQEVSDRQEKNPLLKPSAAESKFRAALCLLANNLDSNLQPQSKFLLLPKSQLLQSLVSCCRERDVEALTTAVNEYASIRDLDHWTTTLLYRIKLAMINS